MTDITVNATTEIDPSTPFCAETFFMGLRAAGARPYATFQGEEKGYGQHYGREGGRLDEPWWCWALEQDPDRSQIEAHVSALWRKHKNLFSDENKKFVLQLGIADDEMLPEAVRIQGKAA